MAEGFEIASAFVRVRPDLDDFEEELQAKLEEATEGAEAKAKVGLDITEFDAKADQVKARLDELDGMEARPVISLDKAGFDADADDAQKRLDDFDGQVAAPRLDLDDDDFKAKADEARDELDDLDARVAEPRLDLDKLDFDAEMDEAEARLDAFNSKSASASLGASGGGGGGEGGFGMPGGMMGALATGLAALSPGFAGAATGLGLLGGAGALAFGGISKALGAAHQASLNVGMTGAQLAAQQYSNSVQVQQAQQAVTQAREQAAQNAITSAQSIEQADMNLASAERNAAASQIQALEQVTQAKQGVEQANYGLTEAEYNLTQAWVQAREQITALDDQLNDSKLSVKAAQLAVEQAEYQQRLVDANAYSTSLDRQQAALAVAQAQQQLVDAQHRETDAQYAANLANKQGIDGSQTVIQAKQGVTTAQYALINALRAGLDAQRNLTLTELNNATQIRQAQMQAAAAREQAAFQQKMDAQAIANAEQNVTQTMEEQRLQMAATLSTSNQAASQFQKYMAALTPAGQSFVNTVLGMRGAFKSLEDAAQNAALPGFTIFLNGVKAILPEIKTGITQMAGAMGGVFAQFGKQMQTPGFAKMLDGLIANGIRFANIVLPALAGFVGELAKIGAQKGAVDGLANLLGGLADGLANLLGGLAPFTGGLSSFFTSLGSALSDLGGPLGTVIGALATTLAPALTAILPAFSQLAGVLGSSLAQALQAAAPGLQAIAQSVTLLMPSLTPLISLLGDGLAGVLTIVSDDFRGLADFIGQNVSWFGPLIALVLTAVGAWKSLAIVQALVNTVMDANPILLVVTALAALVGGVTYAWEHVSGFRSAVKGAWTDIEQASLWLWHNVLDPMWHGIEAGISGVETAALWLWHNVFDPVYQGITQGTETFISGFSTAWGKIETAFKTPVNFLIKTVYDDGVVRFWNDVVGAVGLNSLKLPVIAPLAGGGVIPGYAPGHDTVPALLSPGEAVLTPGATRAIGPATVNALNAAYAPAGAASSPGRYAAGGIVSGAGDVAKALLALATGNSVAFTNAMSPLIGTTASGDLAKVMIAIPKTIISDIVKQLFSVSGGPSGPGLPGWDGAGGLPRGTRLPGGVLTATVQDWFAQAVRLTGAPMSWIAPLELIGEHESGFYPYAVNNTPAGIAAGTPEGVMQTVMGTFLAYHQPGTAMSPFDPVADIAAAIRYIRAVYGDPDRTPGLIALSKGMPYTGYDSGGWLMPGAVPVNRTGRPEAVLTPDESAAFVALVRRMLAQPAGASGVTVIQQYNGTQHPTPEQQAIMNRSLAMALSGA